MGISQALQAAGIQSIQESPLFFTVNAQGDMDVSKIV